jgi:Fe-S-cluster containining protein
MPEPPEDGGLPTVNVPFSLPVGGGTLHASAQVPAGRTTLTELLPILHNLESAVSERVAEEAKAAGHPISCRASCSACCRQVVPVSAFEAEALIRWIASLPEKYQAEVERRFQKALSALRDAGVIDKLLDSRWMTDEQFATQATIDYFKAHVACPFLENENCGIYSIRPLACREYFVTSPPELCRDPVATPVAGVDFPLKITHVLYSFTRKLANEPRGWIPLVFLLGWAKKGHSPGDRVSGTGEEVMKRFLDEMTAVVESEKAQAASEGGTQPGKAS